MMGWGHTEKLDEELGGGNWDWLGKDSGDKGSTEGATGTSCTKKVGVGRDTGP